MTIPIWLYVLTWVVSIILAWLASPPWQRAVKKITAKADTWAEALPEKLQVRVIEAIRWAETNYSNLTGTERMARCIAYLNRFGLPVTPGQVQAVYDMMKALGIFKEDVPCEKSPE